VRSAISSSRHRWLLRSAVLLLSLGNAAVATAQVVITDAPPRTGPARPRFATPPPPEEADPRTFPRTADGKPDFTGIWSPGLAAVGGAPPPLNPAFAAKQRAWQASSDAGKPIATPESRCEAFGMPKLMNMEPLEFIVTAGKQLTIISEHLHEVRRVYLDGRPHPEELEPTFGGHATAHWEGDVLVVDTVGLRANEVPPWLSEQARIAERIRMVNRDALINEVTISDPLVLTGEWKYSRVYRRAPPGQEIEEFVCTNDRNRPDAQGFQTAE
jgi:hypothetical protein